MEKDTKNSVNEVSKAGISKSTKILAGTVVVLAVIAGIMKLI